MMKERNEEENDEVVSKSIEEDTTGVIKLKMKRTSSSIDKI